MLSTRGLSLPLTLAEVSDPSRCALLVYDMQVGVLGQIADSSGVIERAGRALEAARTAGMRTAFCRHLSLPTRWMGAAATRMGMGWQRTDDPEAVKPWFLPDAPGFAITPELQPRPDEIVFDKISMSALEGTILPVALRDAAVTSLAFVGVALEIGIEPSCRHASDLGFIPVLIEDACGGGHAEAVARSIESLRFAGDTMITDVASWTAALAG